MLDVARLSNSAVVMDRGDVETVLRALVAFQEASSAAAEILLARLDDLGGNPDDEDDDPREPDDPGEEDDPSGQCDEDGINTMGMGRWQDGPGCPISDPGGPEHLYTTLPLYGIDQSLGPVNEEAAHRAHMQRVYAEN